MRHVVSTIAITGGLLAGAVAAPGIAAASAGTCDAYSSSCPSTHVKGIHFTKPEVAPTHTTNNSTLPFTGGEIALLSATGIAAVGAGVVLVTAGRRRRRGVAA